MFVFPIAWSQIDWGTYLKVAKDITGDTISEKFDKAGITPGLAAFLVSIGQFCETEGDAYEILRTSGKRLRHIQVSFFAAMFDKSYQELLEESDLTITGTDSNRNGVKAAILTGDGQQWQTTIINCSTERVSLDLRKLANQCQLYFEQKGLGRIWADYSKTPLHDQTLKLVKK